MRGSQENNDLKQISRQESKISKIKPNFLSTQNLKSLRENDVALLKALRRKSADNLLTDFLSLDVEKRKLQTTHDNLQRILNEKQKSIRGAPSSKDKEELKELAKERKDVQYKLSALTENWQRLKLALPNPPQADAPDTNKVLKQVGKTFEGKSHVELLDKYLDKERGAKVSGSRFAYLRGPLVYLQRALDSYALEILQNENFEPVLPPVLVQKEAMLGTGFLPDYEGQVYQIEDLYLTGTSEVALASMHRDEKLENTPLRYAGISTCFRREAGSAGKDTQGLIRLHQFEKVEMFSLVEEDRSQDEHLYLLSLQEKICQGLGLSYQVVDIEASDLGPSAARKYDIEAWFPGQNKYREITSTSNTTDFQSARLRIKGDSQIHALNGTAMTGRFLAALVEQNQKEDHIEIPEVLHSFNSPKKIEF